jgi:hypothetical protein
MDIRVHACARARAFPTHHSIVVTGHNPRASPRAHGRQLLGAGRRHLAKQSREVLLAGLGPQRALQAATRRDEHAAAFFFSR